MWITGQYRFTGMLTEGISRTFNGIELKVKDISCKNMISTSYTENTLILENNFHDRIFLALFSAKFNIFVGIRKFPGYCYSSKVAYP